MSDEPSAKFRLSKEARMLVIIVNVGVVVPMFTQTMMTPAMPAIMRDFGIDAAIGQWITTISMLVSGIMVPVSAFLISRFSTRQIFVTSLGVFLFGTIVCGFAPTFGILIAGRVFQSIGMGVLMPFSAVALMLVYPKEKRGFALGINGIVIGAGPAAGPVVAGLLVDTYGWRFVFFILVPFVLFEVIFSLVKLRNLESSEKITLDWPSVALSTFAFGGLLFGFSMAGSVGWSSPITLGPILLGAVVFVFYARRQFRIKSPLLDLRTLENKVFSWSVVLTMMLQAGTVVGMVITPIYLQMALGYSAFISGLTVMPAAVIMVIMSPFSGIMFDRYGPRQLVIVGLILTIIGTAMLSRLTIETPLIYVTVVYTFRMLGMGFVNMPLTTWGINALPNSKISHGNAIAATARMVASSCGTAIMVTIMMMVQNANISKSGESQALIEGINAAFGIATITMIISLVVAMIMIDRKKEAV